jgi:hypothetical protein
MIVALIATLRDRTTDSGAELEKQSDAYHGSTRAPSSFDPDRWWESRDGVKTEIVELQKLLLDVVLHLTCP